MEVSLFPYINLCLELGGRPCVDRHAVQRPTILRRDTSVAFARDTDWLGQLRPSVPYRDSKSVRSTVPNGSVESWQDGACKRPLSGVEHSE